MSDAIDAYPNTQSEDTIVLGLLDAVDNNSSVTQRHLAQELGIALGLANTYLKRCVRKGLLKVTEAPARRFAYYITPKGFAEKSRLTAQYLTNSFAFLRRARNEFGEIFSVGLAAGATRFVLIGDGDLADVAMLVALKAGVDISGIVPAETEADRLGPAVVNVPFDIAVITTGSHAQATFDAAVAAFGAARVRAPKLLRIKPSSPTPSTSTDSSHGAEADKVKVTD